MGKLTITKNRPVAKPLRLLTTMSNLVIFKNMAIYLASMLSSFNKKWIYSTKRTLEALTLLIHLMITLPVRGIVAALLIYLILYHHWTIKIVCLSYIVLTILDRHTPHRGGRRWDYLRKSIFFEYMASYFPLKVVLTTDLPADKNYLLVSHPHGVWFYGYVLAFAADTMKLQLKHKLKTFLTTINSNFWLPLAREYLLALGFVTASEESLTHVLTDEAGGNLMCLLPGGSAESAYATPSNYRIILNSRKGFCRVAIQTGASLVPSISFGEVDCYNLYMPKRDGWLWRLQLYIKDITGVYPLIYRSPDSWCYMGLPKRTPITIVLGAPIAVTKKAQPTREEISELHQAYITALQNLFEDEKHKYLNKAQNINLVIE